MKFWIAMLFVSLVCSSFIPSPSNTGCYSSEYVQIWDVKYNNESYKVVMMRRDGERIKARCFVARDNNDNTAYNRFFKWEQNNPNFILFSGVGYTGNDGNTQGLAIDHGVLMNQNLINGRMDALVIVSATGGITVSDLKMGDLSVSSIPRKLNLRNNSNDFDEFIEWAKREEATVFQTHLLVKKNQNQIDQRSSSSNAHAHRFLVVGKDETSKYVHILVNMPMYSTIYEGTEKALDLLHYKDIDVVFMINLDTGREDVFELHNPDCSINPTIKGRAAPQEASGLLVYYFE